MSLRNLFAALLAAPMLLSAPVLAQDTLKVAVGQIEVWSAVGPTLGDKAGIFKKHGLNLEILNAAGAGETVQAVISGSADVAINVGMSGVMRAFQKGAGPRVGCELHRRWRHLLVRARRFPDQEPEGRDCRQHDLVFD